MSLNMMTQPDDRGQMVVRRLWPSDGAALRDSFLRLDPEGRARRFMATVSTHHALAHAQRAFTSEGLVFGAFVDDVLRGVGELRPAGKHGLVGKPLGENAEAAFAVESDFRRRGLGTALFQRLAEAARSRGVSKLLVRCLYENQPMQTFAQKVGARMRLFGPESEGAILLDRPTPLSLWGTALAETLDMSRAIAAAPTEMRAAI